MVEHHTKYKEIHGVDEIISMSQSQHKLLHFRLRKEGKCRITVKELRRISDNARNRTEKRRAQHWKQNAHGFNENIGKNVRLREQIIYYPNTGSICYTNRFEGTNGNIIPVINI